MKLLALDFGSSSLKAAILHNDRVAAPIARASYPTHYDGIRAEINPRDILRALSAALHDLGPKIKRIDAIALSVMSPAWLAMDHEGQPLTPLITHQDRRSETIARELEHRLGKSRYLKLAGNRPIPGGISCTTWAWFLQHEPALMKKADLCGHLNTFLHRTLTHSRIIDPSNASFTGFYSTLTQRGWSDTLMDAVGIKRHRLPQIVGSDGVGGLVTHSAASQFGLTHGTPVLAGCVDTSAAMLLAGARPGQLLNVCGSTDVLALCVSKPVPHENVLTRALGVGKKWLSVGTLAAAGSSIDWARQQLFGDRSDVQFWKLISRLSAQPLKTDVTFDAHLAGSRTSLEQRKAAFANLTLSTTREQMLQAILNALARASADRIPLLSELGTRMRRDVLLSGGATQLAPVLHRDWPGKWHFRAEPDATLRGLAKLIT